MIGLGRQSWNTPEFYSFALWGLGEAHHDQHQDCERQWSLGLPYSVCLSARIGICQGQGPS